MSGKLTMCIDPTPEEMAELERLAHRIPEGWMLVPKEPTDEMLRALADDIEKLHVDYNISEFYGLSDWAAFAAGVAKGRRAAAELIRAKAPAKQEGA